jgi:exopolysaccharide biosynthesis polyprenyl glycosylphosphotransferase
MLGSPRRQFENNFVALLVLGDVIVCALAVLAAFAVRAYWAPTWLLAPLRHPLTHYLRALPVVIGVWFVVFALLGMYEPRRTLSTIAARGADLRAASLAVLMIAAASFLAHQNYSRAILLEFWALALALTWAERYMLGCLRRRILARGTMLSRTLIVGTGDLARIVLSRLQDLQFGLQAVGFIATMPDAPAQIEGLPVLGRLEDLPGLLGEHDVDEVLVADPELPGPALMRAIGAGEAAHVEFLIIAGPLQVLTAATELSGPADLPVLELHQRAFGPVQQAAKRLCDVLAATFVLVLAGPLMLGIALAIRRQTGASALFCQRRVGLHGREFTMLKFRTMRADTDAYAPSPDAPDDARVTPVGRWLRRYSLDELPQLFNVLRGEMSIVGPRPEMKFLVDQYEPWQLRRLDALPGLTGLWQILGRKDLPLRENIEYDFYYIRNQSLLLDLSIFLRTLPIVILGKGAY